jgi:YD repeat-containing protein
MAPAASKTDGVDTQSVVYDYDDGGRLASRVDAGFASGVDGTTTYGYDVFGNVTSIAGPGLDLAFTWDRAGNRLTSTQDGVTTTYGYDGNGRLASVGNGWLGSVSEPPRVLWRL